MSDDYVRRQDYSDSSTTFSKTNTDFVPASPTKSVKKRRSAILDNPLKLYDDGDISRLDDQQISKVSLFSNANDPQSTRTAILNDENEDDESQKSRLYEEYEIDTVIGIGTFGTVYRVFNKADNKAYAIKKSKKQFYGIHDKNQMMREVNAMSSLSVKIQSMLDAAKTISEVDSISTVVQFFEAWIEDDHVYIRMELCDDSVENLMKNKHNFEEEEIFVLLKDILLALRTLHK